MARRILDTNILINHWRHTFRGKASKQISEQQAIDCARRLIREERTNAILSPIYVEYLCGPQNKREVRNARAYLHEFHVLDEGRVLPQDWLESMRLAGRISRNGTPRQMGDCLIRAICIRLNLDVNTADSHFPHR
jgi:predicted nucleic acid-binding protein